jgi:nitroreductase
LRFAEIRPPKPAAHPLYKRVFVPAILNCMDAYLAIASRREVRDYDGRPLPDDAVRRILDAGRLAGSSKNRQNRRFVVVRSRTEEVANAVYAPRNVLGAALVVAIVTFGKGPLAFDAGRAAQNMMLAAWNAGIGSCPNGVADAEAMRRALDLREGEQAAIVLSFGYPRRPTSPERRPPERWVEAADRVPFEEAVEVL